MTLNTTRSDVVRAVAESVGYAAKHCLEAAGLQGKISICGGGAESRAWRQVLADVLQQPLEVARRPEVGARGAAMAAMTSAGIDFDHDEWTRPDGEVRPSEDLANLYREGFDRYLTIVEATRGLWNRLRTGPPRP